MNTQDLIELADRVHARAREGDRISTCGDKLLIDTEAALRACVADREDAERYRWMRDAPQEMVEVYFATDKNEAGWGDWNSWLDKAAGIDAARKENTP